MTHSSTWWFKDSGSFACISALPRLPLQSLVRLEGWENVVHRRHVCLLSSLARKQPAISFRWWALAPRPLINEQGTGSWGLGLGSGFPTALRYAGSMNCSCSLGVSLMSLWGPSVGSGPGWWHPTPVLLPGKSHGWRSLVGCSPWGRWGSDLTERLHFHALGKEMATHSSVLAWRIPGTGEPGGLPSMGSQSRTRLKWLSKEARWPEWSESGGWWELRTEIMGWGAVADYRVIQATVGSCEHTRAPGSSGSGGPWSQCSSQLPLAAVWRTDCRGGGSRGLGGACVLVQAWCLGWGWEVVESIYFEGTDNRTSRWASCGVWKRKAARPWPSTPEGTGRMETEEWQRGLL